MLCARGLPLVDADRVARDVVAKGSEGLAEVLAAFGPEVLDAKGELDRAKLGQRVFGDADARGRLNAILHPRIAAESMGRLAALREQGHPLAVYDAALLVENGVHHGMDAVLVVTARAHTQLERMMKRDGFTRDEASARLASQWPLARKVSVARYVVDNEGTLDALRSRVTAVYAALAVQYGPLRGAAKSETNAKAG